MEQENYSSGENIVNRGIEDEMKTAYIDYSMSVIVSRALPDVRDGLKPVHRRVLYGMTDLGLGAGRPYKKSARIVGEVLGKYHPHGDSAVYDTMVRMAQDWSLRYPLVDGQGNFGSIDGDSPAAMRYTEARLRRIAEEMLADLEKNTVDFKPNFDDSLQEPVVLPAGVPNLLINGSSGIAVGMATNMAPHNLSDSIDAVVAYIDNKDIPIGELINFIKAPDFPTGAIIYGMQGVREAYETGRGRVVIRSKATIEELPSGREQIIVTEIPYQVNKASMIEKIAGLVSDKKLDGIADLRDESDRDGLRIVFDIKRDSMASVELNKLFKYTQLQTTFGINNVALVNGRPMTLNLKDMIRHYVDHRHEVVVRRTKYELEEAEKKAHILQGLLIALDHLDEVIALIRSSADPEAAKAGLISRFGLSEIQAKAILDMRLQRLTGLERDKIREEYEELMRQIDYYKSVLADEGLRMGIIKTELLTVREKYGDARRSEIIHSAEDLSIEDMIEDNEVVITITRQGYIKRTVASDYRVQGRGGKGMKGAGTKEEDFVEHLYTARNHNYLLFFTDRGRCYWLKVYEIPEGGRASKGRAIQNLVQLEQGEKVCTYLAVPDLTNAEVLNTTSIIMVTKKGTVKKTELEAYSRPRANGIIAINIDEGDELLEAKLVKAGDHVILAKRSGLAIRFPEDKVRNMGRGATGVRGVDLEDDRDEVIGMVVVENESYDLLVVSDNGYGKRSSVSEYRLQNRGGMGVITLKVTEKTGSLVAIRQVVDQDDLMIITRNGISIRMRVADVREAGRNTQGVRLIRLAEDDRIAAVTKVEEREEEEHAQEGETPVAGPEDTAPATE